MLRLCIIGHVTNDFIIHDSSVRQLAGGVPIYAGIAAAHLGLDVSVLTKLKKEDATTLCKALVENGIQTRIIESQRTSSFENHYRANSWENRKQIVPNISEPFAICDLQDIREELYYAGPLTPKDMPLDFVEQLSKSGQLILDAQGYVRRIREQQVCLTDWKDKADYLQFVSILKVDQYEAEILTGAADLKAAAKALASFGPRKVIITAGRDGALVWDNGIVEAISAIKPRKYIDPTGCGDTFLAAFIARQLQGADTNEAGQFAAAAAALKIEKYGALGASIEDIRKFQNEAPLH